MSTAPRGARRAVLLLALLLAPVSAGCLAPDALAPACDAEHLLVEGTAFLAAQADDAGGIRSHPTADPDPRLTAWALIAAGLARRTGHEDLFDPDPHLAWLPEALPLLLREGTAVDSAANNLSLARAALQAWGRSTDAVSVAGSGPGSDAAADRSLAAAWEARYSATTGRYGARLNEHLFAGFAARLFEADAARLAAMAHALDHDGSWPTAAGHDPFDGDVWFAAYARALLGPTPHNASLAARLDATLTARQQPDGGSLSIPAAHRSDASSTAAAVLAWGESGAGATDARIAAAVGFLCATQRADGAMPFRAGEDVLVVKTTAEAVAALALLVEPVPRPR